MPGSNCVDHPRCDRYEDLRECIYEAGTCWGETGMNDATLNSRELRSWWNKHGCVRCWIEACEKLDSGKWERTCKDIGNEKYIMGNPQIVEEMETAYKNWNNPRSRLRDRFYCASHVKPLRCGCSLFDSFPGDVGHVGWVYFIPEPWRKWYSQSECMIGEETVTRGDEGAFTGVESTLRQMGYQKWKPLWSRDGNFEEAYLVSKYYREKLDYDLITNNCNIATNAVLTAFGADLIPSSSDAFGGNFTPGNYFNAVRVPAVDLDKGPSSRAKEKSSASPERVGSRLTIKTAKTISADVSDAANSEPTYEQVYRVANADVVHLIKDCPALMSRRSRYETLEFPATSDFTEIEQAVGYPVCGTCARLAAPRLHLAIESKTMRVEFRTDRLVRITKAGLLSKESIFELMYLEIRTWTVSGPSIFTSMHRLALQYRLASDLLPIPSVVDLWFDTESDCLRCADELQKIFPVGS